MGDDSPLSKQRSAGSPPDLSGCQAQAVPRPSSRLPVVEEQADAVFDLETAMKRCLGNRDILSEFVKGFFADVDDLLRRMRDAAAGGDTNDLSFAAHRLGGSLRYLATPPALHAAQRVERIALSGDLTGAAAAVDQLEQQAARLAEAMAPFYAEISRQQSTRHAPRDETPSRGA
jgi:HPt (histidine-containing phosphotransfer) domain-containing protein